MILDTQSKIRDSCSTSDDRRLDSISDDISRLRVHRVELDENGAETNNITANYNKKLENPKVVI